MSIFMIYLGLLKVLCSIRKSVSQISVVASLFITLYQDFFFVKSHSPSIAQGIIRIGLVLVSSSWFCYLPKWSMRTVLSKFLSMRNTRCQFRPSASLCKTTASASASTSASGQSPLHCFTAELSWCPLQKIIYPSLFSLRGFRARILVRLGTGLIMCHAIDFVETFSFSAILLMCNPLKLSFLLQRSFVSTLLWSLRKLSCSTTSELKLSSNSCSTMIFAFLSGQHQQTRWLSSSVIVNLEFFVSK